MLQLLCNDSSSDSLTAELAPCFLQVGLQAPLHVGVSLEDTIVQGSGHKRPFHDACDTPTGEDGSAEDDEGGDDSPTGSHNEKKRRLTLDQVRSLETSFEVVNKLEPEKKMQLAKELGLRPRQVAVWFQNRRARWKTKQLERDYETLAADYKTLMADYEHVVEERNCLRAEVVRLTGETPPSPQTDRNKSVNDRAPQTPEREVVISGAVARQRTSRISSTVDISLVCAKDQDSETNGLNDGNSGDVVNADSPRISDCSSPTSMPDQEQLIHSPEFPPPKSFGDLDHLLHELHHDVPMKLEDESGHCLHDDQSCNYLLFHPEEQTCVLPWWDWP
ncbi:uncharacterized protein [Physcomitrium patens]|uniref:Homeobox domain-containing protein n=1 Tax=Physcomitrium patens TaxID=3218 RepID=A0A2K1KMK3_PHYPA|nr:homeobox-leucine zipper protein HOX20-like [Physcomitrium patens]PNR54996.1 hypothetical protein PHYPA_005889 [Physcomitrium patens]|eukprot:XP_024372505.1 homeobox-leucine zipper protein HOX20-like [Physcomitrella patens]